jgi:hypothetical protein
MKHAKQKRIPEVKVGQRYLMPSGAMAIVVHLRGDAEVGLEYENKRYKGRAEQVAMSTANVKSICTYVGEVDGPQT